MFRFPPFRYPYNPPYYGYYNNYANLYNLQKQQKEKKEDSITNSIEVSNTIHSNSHSETYSDTEKSIFEIFGIKLYLDDLIILGLLFFLYQQNVQDEMLYIILFLLLFS